MQHAELKQFKRFGEAWLNMTKDILKNDNIINL